MTRIPIPSPREAPAGTEQPAIARSTGWVRSTCRARDGRSWSLLAGPSGVTVASPTATIAEAHVWERDGTVMIEFWVDGADLPDELSEQLVEQAFANTKVTPRRPVLLCIPRRDGGLLQHALGRVDAAHTRAAGMTCLVEGEVGSPSPHVGPSSR